MKVKMDYKLAHAIAWDAGNRSMRAGKRTQWSMEDQWAMCDAFEKAIQLITDPDERARLGLESHD